MAWAAKILLGGPGRDGVDDVDHHLIEGGVDLVLGFGAGVAQGGPAHAGGSADHEGGGTGEAAVMPPVSGSVVADHPAAGVASVACGRGGGGGGHCFDSFGLEERGDAGCSGDVVEELDEFGGGGDPSVVGVHAGDIEIVGVFGVLAVVDDFVIRSVIYSVAGDLHGGDAAGAEDVGANVGFVGFVGDLLDDSAEDAVAEVGVGPVSAGRVGDGDFGDGVGDEFGLVPGEVEHHGIGVVVGPAATGVGEEMVHGDVGDEGFVGRLAVVEDAIWTEDFVVEVELALFDEGEDGDGGDGLGDGGDAEEGVSLDLGVELAVTDADGLVVDELAVAGDGDRGCRDRELLAEPASDAAHFVALLAGGSVILRLGKGLECGEVDGCCGSCAEELLEELPPSESRSVH